MPLGSQQLEARLGFWSKQTMQGPFFVFVDGKKLTGKCNRCVFVNGNKEQSRSFFKNLREQNCSEVFGNHEVSKT